MEDKELLEKIFEKNKMKERFIFNDGPITANGPVCLHHCWGRTIKDAFNRVNTLFGKNVMYQYGFDAQGMWVEVEVEKLLGLNEKKEIVQYGLDKFTEKCIETVNHFKEIQTAQSKLLGMLGDWDNSYITNSDKNIESIWHFLKVCNDKKMIKQSYKCMPWCPRCGTSLSEHEMTGSYRERTHKAVFVKAKLAGRDERIMVWTTTPWTLPANVAIAVNPEIDYVVCHVRSEENLIIVCKGAEKLLRDDLIRVERTIKGTDLVGLSYEPFLKFQRQQFPHKIVPWADVDANDGAGAVHIAPGCGAEDFFLISKLNKMKNDDFPFIIPVDESGSFGADFPELQGFNTVNCEEFIFERLKDNDTYYYAHNHSHNYPFCWRCKTDVIFRLVSGWDIATDEIRQDLISAAKSVDWEPDFMLKSMLDWLSNMGDWNISRKRFYGLPLPFYPCPACGHFNVIESKKELLQRSDCKCGLPHLHRPYIDKFDIKCERCGKAVKRIADVGDCWLDAGIVPFSTATEDWKTLSEPELFKCADLVTEMKEQVRLWFYAQLFMSVVLIGSVPYKKVVGYSTMLDENGKKFSKTGLKKISVEDAIAKHGVDALRWTFAAANPSYDMRFGDSMADESKRKLIAIKNAFVFYKTYADIDKPKIENYKPNELNLIDTYLLEITNQFIAETRRAYTDFHLHRVVELTNDFIENISNFYIRANRRRFWRSASDTDKLNAYFCLRFALRSLAVVICPIVPNFANELLGEEIMLLDYPYEFEMKRSGGDKIKDQFEIVKKVISLALTLRAEQDIALKQPLSKLFIKNDSKTSVNDFQLIEIIKEQVNVKDIEFVTDDNKFNTPYLAVDFKAAGAVLKGEVQVLKTKLEGLDEKETARIVDEFDRGTIENKSFYVRKLKTKFGFVIQSGQTVFGGNITVVLDTHITKKLEEEGKLREFIRSVQVLRQEQHFNITDKIIIKTNFELANKYAEIIKKETLAVAVKFEMGEEDVKTVVELA
ncbi:MAG: class I tRNA ligase family protein [Christensenellaceae bacterium]|nr:class I tRNA ligase family protein [Christensenellaceae bacterium]